MKLSKIYNNPTLQIYSISNPSKDFKKKYPGKFIITMITSEGLIIDNPNILEIDEILAYQAVAYIFTYNEKLPGKVLDYLSSAAPEHKCGNWSTSPACLDRYYTEEFNVVFEIYPKDNIVSPLFNRPVTLRISDSKLKYNQLARQLITAANNILLEKAKTSKDITVEQWVLNFIEKPFMTPDHTCVIYPKTISDTSITNVKQLQKNDLIIRYDVRAKSHEDEVKIFSAIGEAFESSENMVTVYDTYNGLLEKVKKELDSKKLKYKVLHQYAITTKYSNLKKLNIEYDLTDFL